MEEKKVKVSTKDKRKGFTQGFKAFITKGNVIDMAVGVVIGGAFGKIITSIVNNVILPPIGVLLGGVNFSDLKWNIKPIYIEGTMQQAVDANQQPMWVSIGYGTVIQNILEFLIIALVIYTVITLFIRRNQFNEKLEAEAKAKLEAEEAQNKELEEQKTPEDIQLLMEIRDLLKK